MSRAQGTRMAWKMNRICCNATSCRGWLRMAFLTDLSFGALNQAMKASLVTEYVVYITKNRASTRRFRGCIRRSFGDEFR